MSSPMRIVIAQLNLLVGDVAANGRQVVEAALRARDEHRAQVIVFPELTLTGYPPEDLLLRPGLLNDVERVLDDIRQQVSGIAVVLGFPQRTEAGLMNAAAVLQDGKMRALYGKQHLPNYGVFDEKRYFIAGDSPCVVNILGVPVALTICEDIWFADTVQAARQAGARLILNLNASPFHRSKSRQREQELQQRTAESGLPIVYVNLVGGQDELVFDGESLAMAADGSVCFRAPAFEQGLYPVEMNVAADGAVTPVPGSVAVPLAETENIYRALVLGLRDYIEKNGFPGAIIGLSGGIDSALTLAITVDAIGAQRVEAVMMPTRYTLDMSQDDAAAQAESLGIEYHVLPVEPVFTAFLDTLAEEFAGLPVDTAEENIQARCRGTLLMAISNKKHKVVITTGNKSEMSVGYATLYGDMAGGFAVLKDVPKTLAYRLAEYRNQVAMETGQPPVIPQRVIDRPPSAELAEDQQDTDSLPPYEILDAILEMYIEQDRCAEDIVTAGYDTDTVRRVITLVNRNEYKRRQAPPGVRISQRAFGRDRRYPITSGYDQRVAGGQNSEQKKPEISK
ncbi:MAG: NAD+ synthase [Gammaproteobacteria bacterium]|nr:NAD+ synthase [Gammaproteobacteria bacterium]